MSVLDRSRAIVVLAATVALASGVLADPPANPPAKPEAKPAAKPASSQTPPAAPPSLDDLLGIKPAPKPTPPIPPTSAKTEKPEGDKPKTDGAPDGMDAGDAPDRDKVDLDRMLSSQEMGDAFKAAVTLMGDASLRLDHKDPGLDTQRIQEDALRRLDQLIASLQKKKSESQSSGKSNKPGKNSDSKDKAPSKGPAKPGDQQQKQGGATGKTPGVGPTLQEGALNPQLESARAAWGSLPARVREMLMQGTEDRFSARYKLLTQEYYKRLAEEGSK